MTKAIKVVSIIVVMFFMVNMAKAQFGPGGGSTPGGPGSSGGSGVPADAGVPFDGGLSIILIAAGAGLGAKKRNALLAVK